MNTMKQADYDRIESEIACDSSPVGIDAKKTHVLILAKLEAIEHRLDSLEKRAPVRGVAPGAGHMAMNGVAIATDAVDEAVARLADRGIDVDSRLYALVRLVETLTDEGVLTALERIVSRLHSLEPVTALASHGPAALATFVDTFDDEVARLRDRGIDVDAALRNGIAVILFLGPRIRTGELESLGELLRSDVLHPRAVDIVGRLGCALVAATEEPLGSVGPFKTIRHLGESNTKRSTAFLLAFARHFGAALNGDRRPCREPIIGDVES